ncbi:hypothetical protein BDZ91DRAFT_793405 [Kalaharituber pfeilii]|nr:hypothetical protein BDZ91DRAFT_793405 [Kalaharituber pfeilii]
MPMAPVRRKKLSTTPPPPPPPPPSPPHLQLKPGITSVTPLLSPSKMSANAPARLRSPIRKSHNTGLTSPQRKVIIDNLMLEMNERVRRLRAQYEVQAQALKRRIEMRINRVPKKLWNAKMGDLLLKHAKATSARPVASSRSAAPVNAKVFVEEVKRLSSGRKEEIDDSSEVVTVPKKKITKKIVGSGSGALMHLSSSSSANPLLSSSPSKAHAPRLPLSPVKRTLSPVLTPQGNIRKVSPLRSSQFSNTDSNSLSAAESNYEKGSEGKPTMNLSRSNALKTRNIKTSTSTPQPPTDEKQFVKSIGSSGSLKENKVEGLRKEKTTNGKAGKTSASIGTGTHGGRRVLRARK